MHFSVTMALCLHFLLRHGVNSSQHSFLKNRTLSIVNRDNIFGKFISEYIQMQIETYNPREVTIVGASGDELQQAQSLNDGCPFIICADLARCDFVKRFDSRNLFIVFLEDINKPPIKTNLSILSACGNTCLFLFLLKGKIKKNYISPFLFETLDQRIGNPELAYLDKGTVELYRVHLAKNCSTEIEVTLTWRPGTDLTKIYSSDFIQNLNLHGCPLTIGTFLSNPKMKVETIENGLMTKVSGSEGVLVSLIAEKINCSIVVKYPAPPVNSDESLVGSMINEISSGTVELGIGRLRTLGGNEKKIQSSMPYGEECLSWAVPRISRSTSNLVWAEFPWRVWVFIGLVFVLSCAIKYIHNKINSQINGNRQRQGFVSLVLDILAVNLGYPIIYVPVSKRIRTILTMFLLYSIVITTAYRTSLASILTTMQSSSAIVDTQGILEANLKVGGTRAYLNTLKHLDPSNVSIQKVIERYEVINELAEFEHRLIHHNFAWLDLHSTFENEKQLVIAYKELLTHDVFDQCILTYSSALLYREGSFLRKSINQVVMRVVASGLLDYWDTIFAVNNNSSGSLKAVDSSKLDTKRKLINIFLFYNGCIFLCLLVFFIELLIPKFKLKKIKRVFRREQNN